ncbi:hypothetical protein K488DRAFT_57119, partial [Vararia minispora EC-137]
MRRGRWANSHRLKTGLFSATVAAFAIDGYKSLRQDPTDVSAALLAHISGQLSSLSNASAGVPAPAVLPAFQPPSSMLYVNIFWFLSLVVSISCALAATMIQQWSRRYLALTQGDTTPKRRARARTFFHVGVKKYHLSAASKLVPALLHGSVFLFFAGLVQFAFTIHRTLAWAVLAAVSALCFTYAVLTVMPALSANAPYFTPLS